jgi:hypothetical protein
MNARIASALMTIAAVLLAATADARAPQPERSEALQVVEAVWKAHTLHFAYQGYATIYSCGALRAKLQQILEGLGARDTLKISMWGCNDLGGGGRIQIDMESPVEATPENIQALTTYDSQDVLIARVREERLAAAEDIQRFPATWKTISFTRDKAMKLGPADCELVEQLRRSVLPAMSIRIDYERLHCSVAFGNIGQPQLRVTALVPVQTGVVTPVAAR